MPANDSTELSVEAIPCRITCKLLPEAISVQGDPKLLRSILRNLLVNALTYSLPETQVDFVLTYDKTEATFLIQDQGMGIPAADQDHVFKPFFRAENAKIKTGAGLGLAIAKTCTELHGGNITLVSTSEGTCVTVRLPMPMHTEALERELQL
ncbi:MAG: sensor histidine kinase [Synechococcales cyanobacterium CRU_2_2]|nr:sensor histidine kinase [Synechococcales cyanobacterium CRU_2_2]